MNYSESLTTLFIAVAIYQYCTTAQGTTPTTPKGKTIIDALQAEIPNPNCQSRENWKFVAESNVTPKKFLSIVLYEKYPDLFKKRTGPDGQATFEGIPENDSLYRDVCALMCVTSKPFECRFYSYVYPFICILANYTNEWDKGKAFSNPFYEVPRVCRKNDGCTRIGEYFADSFSRCHFYQCAHGGNTGLRATRLMCPASTLTRDTFTTSREESFFTQPCSEFGVDCKRPFPRFTP